MAWIEPFWWRWFSWVAWCVFGYVLWTQRLAHVWPKRGEIQIVNPAGVLFRGMGGPLPERGPEESPLGRALSPTALLRPSRLSCQEPTPFSGGWAWRWPAPEWYDRLLDVVAILVLVGIVLLAIRRYVVEREKMTHPVESGIILGLIALLMITHLLEQAVAAESLAGMRTGGSTSWFWPYSRPSSPRESTCT